MTDPDVLGPVLRNVIRGWALGVEEVGTPQVGVPLRFPCFALNSAAVWPGSSSHRVMLVPSGRRERLSILRRPVRDRLKVAGVHAE